MHFWAHALRAFLAARGRADAFGPLAGHCLCDAVPAHEIATAFGELARRIAPSFEILRNADYRAGYRMIEQPELVSFVAERESERGAEFVAVFWLRPTWLTNAKPHPLEPLEFIDPP
jgi:hypothetical protein